MSAFDGCQFPSQPLGQGDAARMDADEDRLVQSFIAFDDFMGNAADSPADCFFVHEQCLFFPHMTHHLSVFLFRPFEAGQEISRCRRFKMHGLPRNGMDQVEAVRMKGLAFDGEIILLVAI